MMKSENTLLIKSAFTIANKVGAKAVLVHADPLDDLIFDERVAKKFDLILLSKKKKLIDADSNKKSLAVLAKNGAMICSTRSLPHSGQRGLAESCTAMC